ncbi:cell division protein SepF [Candidatus Woesearchaeota archaeon]|nr:cell division protein SepF [Candidatus Woesearchaeota archaeon]
MRKFLSKIRSAINPPEETDQEDGYVEIEGESESPQKKIVVRPFTLKEFEDIKDILETLRKGNTICLVNIKPLKDKDLLELKQAINKLKKTCDAHDGEIAGFGEEWIVVTPSFATIYKSKAMPTVDDDDEERSNLQTY